MFTELCETDVVEAILYNSRYYEKNLITSDHLKNIITTDLSKEKGGTEKSRTGSIQETAVIPFGELLPWVCQQSHGTIACTIQARQIKLAGRATARHKAERATGKFAPQPHQLQQKDRECPKRPTALESKASRLAKRQKGSGRCFPLCKGQWEATFETEKHTLFKKRLNI